MNKWMNEWIKDRKFVINKLTLNGWMDKWMNDPRANSIWSSYWNEIVVFRWINEWINEWMYELYMNKWTRQ